MSNGTIMLDVLAAMISLSTDLETFEQQLNNVSNATPLLPITAYDIIKLT
jgi:hypothetical protein